jgi:hypothetical protein
MKRAIGLILLIIAIPRLSNGQNATPEFELNLHYSDAGGSAPSSPVAFGYDPQASDTLQLKFGEQYYPGPAPGGFYLAFLLPGDSIASQIEVLQKPSIDSFTLQYTIYLSANVYPAVLSWDRSSIPSAIKSITITPPGASFLLMADMTKQDSVVIDDLNPTDTNYATNWEPATITLYYNTAPLSVSPTPVPNTGLLSGLITYPNPMGESGDLSFSLTQAANIVLTGYDAIGREVLHMTKSASAGENILDLSGLATERGAILLRVDAASGFQYETKGVMLVKE